ncbi:phage tail tape measure protein [Amycolatopsis sp. H20-H5]|uniref:phage tail tape measure protein n=1 Tax=Amycolatopsis sp. H20-H5 TaxID=3046309 RepID=UPI002DBF2C87|nr:phage tail tape measure protein [Amycolatopsis sp. H20-H5]MEC3977908.1 phage tail tape measure protein [Amycolatopsis sp. H20-H5]
MALSIGELVGFINLDDKGFASGLDGAFEKFKGFGGKLGVAALGLGVAAAGALGVGLAGAMDASAANSKLAAQLGLSKDQAAVIGKTAGEVYSAGFGDSLEGVNDALRSVIQNMDVHELSGDALKGLTEAALNLSTAFGVDVTESTKAAGQMMKTGLAKDSTEAFDIITAGMQSGVNASDDFLDTLNEYSTQFRKLGLDGVTATGLLSQGLQAGARDSDIVADGLKEFAIRVSAGGKATNEAYQSIGLSGQQMTAAVAAGGDRASVALQQTLDALRGVKDPVAQSAAAVALFGTQAEDLGAALYALDPSTTVDSLGQVGGAATEMGQTLNDNATANLTSFTRQMSQAFVTVAGTYVLPIVEKIASALATLLGPALQLIGGFLTGTVIPALMGFAQWVEQNSTTIGIVAGIITAVFLPALIAMGVQATINAARVVAGWVLMQTAAILALVEQSVAVVGVVAGWVLMGVQSLIQAARMAAAWVIAMGPVGWIIALVVGLVALIIANWDSIKQWTIDAWNAIWKWVSDRITDVRDWVRDRLRDVLSFFEWLGDLPGKVSAWFGDMKDAAAAKLIELINWARGLPDRILDALGDLGQLLVNQGKAILRGFLDGLKNQWHAITDFVGGIGSWIADHKGPLSYDRRLLAPAGQVIMQGFHESLRENFAVVQDFIGDIAPSIADSAGDMTGVLSGGGRYAIAGTVGGQAIAPGMTGGGRALVHIDNYHPPADAPPDEVARGLDWLSKSGGY